MSPPRNPHGGKTSNILVRMARAIIRMDPAPLSLSFATAGQPKWRTGALAVVLAAPSAVAGTNRQGEALEGLEAREKNASRT